MAFDDKSIETRSRLVVAGVCLSILGFVGWAAFAEVDEVTRAIGKTIPTSRTQVIQAPDGGVVKEILVHEGQRVSQGDLLVRLNESKALAAVTESEGKVAALRAAVTRLKAELMGAPLIFGKELQQHPEFIANQRALYQRRQESLRASSESLMASIRLTKEELEMSLPLLKDGDIGKTDILRLKRQLAEQTGQLSNLRNKYHQDAQAELTKTEEDLSSVLQALADRSNQLEHTVLHAPTNGVVNLINQTTVGAVLRPGEEIMQILPTGDGLIVEAKLRSSDVGFVRQGLPVTVKLDAFDYSIYGTLKGKVSYVSSDALNERNAQGQEQIFYRMQVKIDPGSMLKPRGNKSAEIQPGMTCTVEVRTGVHSILGYLTKPVVKTLSESISER